MHRCRVARGRHLPRPSPAEGYEARCCGSCTLCPPLSKQLPFHPTMSAEDFEARLMGEVAAEVQRQEVERCRQWLARGKPGGMSHGGSSRGRAVVAV